MSIDNDDVRLSRLARRYKRGLVQLWIVGATLLAFELFVVAAALLYIPPGKLETIQHGAVPTIGGTDFSTFLITAVVAAIGFIVGFLGLKRLEQFDKQIDALRSELSAQVHTDYSRLGEEMRRFQVDLHDSLQRYERVVNQLAESAVKTAVSEQRSVAEERWAKFLSDTKQIEDRVNTSLRPFAWLESRKDELDELVGVSTIGVAHSKVTTFYREGKVDVAISIADHAITGRLPGSNVDCHNLGAELARRDQHPLALQVVELALERFPADMDLLADAISYANLKGDLQRAQEHYDVLRSVSFDQWKWRNFTFAGDFLENCGRSEEALELYAQYRMRQPTDERAYSQTGSYLMSMGRYKEASTHLAEALENCRKVGQCGVHLAECYMELGEYDLAIRAADRAIESNAESQPSSAQAAAIWYRANALDAIIHRSLQSGNWSARTISDQALQCVLDYLTSISMPDSLEPYDRRGPERLRILRALLVKHGIDTSFMDDAKDQWGDLIAQIGKTFAANNARPPA